MFQVLLLLQRLDSGVASLGCKHLQDLGVLLPIYRLAILIDEFAVAVHGKCIMSGRGYQRGDECIGGIMYSIEHDPESLQRLQGAQCDRRYGLNAGGTLCCRMQ